VIIPIRLTPVELHIHADRRLAFEVLSAFGARQEDGGSSAVLRDEGVRKLVEFHTVFSTPRGRKTHRTVEWVTLHAPDEILFEGVEGPLQLLRDRFTLHDAAGCTRFRYESTFGLEGAVVGWLRGQLLVRPIVSRFMRVHSFELKKTIEARALKSRVYPVPPRHLLSRPGAAAGE
jgi:hypothetical protein